MKSSKCLLLMVPVLLLWGVMHLMRRHMPTQWKYEGASRLWLSRDGSLLVSQRSIYRNGVSEEQARIWDVNNRRLIGDVSKIGDVLALADDGRRLITKDAVWDLSSGGIQRAWTIAGPGIAPLAAKFTASSIEILWPECVEVRAATGRVLRRVDLQASTGRIGGSYVGALSPDSRLAALSHDGEVDVFKGNNGHMLRTCTMPSDYTMLNGLEFSPDGHTLMGTPSGMTDPGPDINVQAYEFTGLCLWDIISNKQIEGWYDTNGFHSSFSPDSRAFLYRGVIWNYKVTPPRPTYQPLEFRDLTTQRRAKFQIPHPWGAGDARHILDVCLASNGHVMAALDENGNIWVQDIPH